MADLETLADGVHLIDTHYIRPAMAGSWLVVQGGRAAFVEVNTTLALPRLLGALGELGLDPDVVDYVVVTHVHLDHAGGAGALLRHLPNARLVVHPAGARHMVDPARLVAAATAVYGADKMDALYGEVFPVDQGRVISAEDGMALDLAGRPLVTLHTPGHARHHLAVLDHATRGVFTGDVFGLGYPALDTPGGRLLFPTTAPTQFDPEAMMTSVKRIAALRPAAVYLTHFGAVGDVSLQAGALIQQIQQWCDVARAAAAVHPPGEARTRSIAESLEQALRERYLDMGGASMDAFREWTEMDRLINAQGLAHWLNR